MERKQSRSIGLIIRRIIAGFIFLSTISGVVAAIETNSFNEDVIPGVFVSLLKYIILPVHLEIIDLNQMKRLKIIMKILIWMNCLKSLKSLLKN